MNGLRTRLVTTIGATVLVALAVAFAVVYRETGAELKSQLNVTLRSSAAQLADAIRAHPSASPDAALAAARRFARAQPYSNASVLVFAIVPGHGTASNYPELFGYSKPDNGEPRAEQRTENAEGRHLAIPSPGFASQPAPDTGLLRTFEREVTLAGGLRVYAGAAEPLAGIARAQHGVRRSYLLAGGLALALALIGASIAGSRMAAPLRHIASRAAEIDAGDLTPRIRTPSSASREVRVLATAFNHMLDRLRNAFEAQQRFVGDASHELRTPLTVIRGQLDLLASEESAAPEEIARVERIIKAEVGRMSRLTDDLLVLMQSGETDFLHLESLPIRPFIQELWDGLSLTADRRFEIGALPDVTFQADPDRLAQALRNLGRNAIQHTREPNGLVRIEASVTTVGDGRSDVLRRARRRSIRFTVTDNGPGVAVELRDRIFERFYRADPARTRASGGAGLGLAIVKAIAEAHGGAVAVAERVGGGAAIALILPLERDEL